MSSADFFSDAAKARAKAAVEAVERETAAEIVVTVRKASSAYREATYLGGAVLGFLALLLLLFLPQEFDVRWMPADVLLGFVIGGVLGHRSDTIKRILTSRGARKAALHLASRAAFVDLGISKTTGRTGILVYVSMLEREVALVGDVACASLALDGTRDQLSAAVRARDFEAFAKAVESLGPICGKTLPRSADDVNELPDEVHA